VKSRLDTLLTRSPADARLRRALVIAGFFTIPMLGALDWVTGAELSFSIFYLLPLFLVSWYGGQRTGVVASLLAALTWLLADVLAGHHYSETWMPYWNMGVRLGIFLVTSLLLARLVELQRRRRLLERMFFHDLLNLAGSLRGFAELLQDEVVRNRQEIAGLLERTADRVVEEIEAQRVFSEAESGELELTLEETSGHVLLQTLASIYAFHSTAENRRILLGECTPVAIVTDQTLLIRVLGNLLKNALEATPPGGDVTLTCRQQGDELVFAVHNPGEIPPGLREGLFKGASSKGRGRGLGLRSSLQLVKVLGGVIRFESGANDGTTFFVRLPASRQ